MYKFMIPALFTAALLLGGCVFNTGVAVTKGKAYVTTSAGGVEVCDVSSDGTFKNCRQK